MCGGEGSMRCIQCGPAAVFCYTCDVALHCIHFPLHDRQIWREGFYMPVSPAVHLSDEGDLLRQGDAA